MTPGKKRNGRVRNPYRSLKHYSENLKKMEENMEKIRDFEDKGNVCICIFSLTRVSATVKG